MRGWGCNWWRWCCDGLDCGSLYVCFGDFATFTRAAYAAEIDAFDGGNALAATATVTIDVTAIEVLR